VPGPTNAADALVWIREAIAAGRYIVDAHFMKRARTRSFSVNDAKKIIATATACAEYPDATILAGGTAWRVTGTALDGTTAKVGAEAYRDHLGKQIILITIMDG
jgi:hypothetical protein